MVRTSDAIWALSAVCVVVLAGCGGGGSGDKNAAPTTTGATLSVNEDQAGTVTITAIDPDGDPLTVSITTPPTKGAAAVTSGLSFSYTPTANQNGADQFSYRVTDPKGASANGMVNISIAAQPDAPTAPALSLSVNEDTIGSVSITAADADGETLTATVNTQPTKGTVTVAGTNPFVFTFTPTANLNGADTFSYRVTDTSGLSVTANVPVTIAPQPDAPVAPASTLTFDEDTAGSVSITATDADREVLTATVSTPPAKGAVAVTGTNPFVFAFTPTANANGSDTFAYRVTDTSGASTTAQIAVTITPRPDAPAVVANITTIEDTSTNGTLASDPDGDAVMITVVTPPAHGTLQVANGAYNYAPAPDYFGDDSFTVTVSDGALQSQAVVPIHVTPVNDPPVAVDDAVVVDQTAPTTINVAANDTDVDGDPLTVEVLEQPPGGAAVVVGGSIQFTPNAAAAGPTAFRYRVVDAGGVESAASVRVVIGYAAPLFFLSDTGGSPGIYRYDFLSAPELLVTPLPAGASLARFVTSANGAWLVYVSRNVGTPTRDRLWLKNLDDLSAPVREITTDSLFFTNYLAISPDGAIVVFNSRYATTADPATARDVDGVNTINNPTFTRDSQYLYYTVLLSGGGRIIKRADVPLSGVLTNYRPMTKDYDPAQGLGMSFVLTPDETRIVSTALIILGPPISSLKTLVYVTTADGSQDDAVLHPDFTNNVDYAYLPVITADSRYAFYANTINGQTNVSWTALNAPGTKVDVGNNPDGFNTTVAGDRAVFFRYYSGATQPWAWAEVNPTAIRGNFNPVGSGVPAPRSLAAAPDGSAVVFDGGAGIYAARGSQFSTATLLFTRPVSAAPTLLYAPESSSVAAANTSGLVMANPKAPGWVSDVLAQSEGQPGGPRCLAYVGGTCAY